VKVPKPGDVAPCIFTGWLDADGGKGRNSTIRTAPARRFLRHRYRRVMPGWNEGVIGMRPAGKRLVKVPAETGLRGQGVQDVYRECRADLRDRVAGTQET